MQQLQRVSHKSGRPTSGVIRRYFFFNQAKNKKPGKIHKLILLLLAISLFIPMSVFAAAPVFSANGPFNITENSSTGTLVGQVVASEATSYTITGGNGSGAFTIDNSGFIRVADGTQIDFEVNSSFSLTVEAGNLEGTDSAAVIINVINVNDPPKMDQGFYTFSINENLPDTSLVGTVSATDNDPGDTVTYNLIPGPVTAFSIDSDDGEIRIADTTQIDYESGTTSYTIYVLATDGGLSDIAPVTITINEANDAPVAVADGPYNASEDTPLAVTLVAEGVLNNDTDQDVDPVDTLTAVLDTQPPNGSVTLNDDGTFTYTPKAQFDGTDSFTYHANDGSANSNIVTVTITVAGSNDDPTATNDTYSTDEDTTLTVSLVADGVLDNDTDPENDTLTVTNFNATSVMGAAVSVNTDGTFSYNPTGSTNVQALDAGDNTSDSFTYTISDGNTGTDTGTVTINLSGLNDAPNAVVDGFTLNENSTNNNLTVLGNDTDADASATLTITAVANPTTQGGTATISGSTILYTPLAGFDGTDTFTYTISDGVLTDTATVTITVNNLNNPPVITEGASYNAGTIDEDNSPTFFTPFTLNATDTDGDNLTWSIPVTGTALLGTAVRTNTYSNPSNVMAFNYTPTANMNGSDSFVVRVSDGKGGTDDITVTVTITEVNDNPDAVDDTPSVNEQSSNNTLYPLSNDTIAPDTGETLTITAVGATNHGGTVTSHGTSLTYTPLSTFIGTETFTYTISDGRSGTDTATIRVTVNDVNFNPVITEGISTTVTMDEDGSPTDFSLTLHATDADAADTLTWAIQSQAGYGDADVTSGTGTSQVISYAPVNNYNGNDAFMVYVSDGHGGMDSILVNVIINPINDAPTAKNDTKATPPDTAVTINVLDNDTDPENDSLSITAVTQGSKGSVSHNGATITYTPNPGEIGDDTFTYTISDGSTGTDTGSVTVRLGLYEVFMPVLVNNFVSAPDLVVTNISASSDLIELVIENQGTQATTSGFWVDFYIAPDPVPTHENQLWGDVGDEGIVWGVTVSIPAGGSLTLTYSTAPGAPNLYFAEANSNYGGVLPVGTPVYAQVDSAHLNTSYGGVLETHEILGEPYNNVSAEFTAVATGPASLPAALIVIQGPPLALPAR